MLSGIDAPAELSSRAKAKLEDAREPFHWLDDESTAIVKSPAGASAGDFCRAPRELCTRRGDRRPLGNC